MMLNGFRRKLEIIWMKNGDDIRAMLTGSLPRFLKAPDDSDLEDEVPVFCFHSVQADLFEAQLRYLATNGYQTITADDLLAVMRGEQPLGGRTVALTFDDATGSFWAVAFPLLQKYQFKAILFVIPGLVPADPTAYPNLEDVWRGSSDLTLVANREHVQPLCTWPELMVMNESGLVDIQSHSLTHTRINISPKVVDFIHPHFDPHFFENVNVPVMRDDDAERPLRPLRWGQPVYESASRLGDRPRFLENSEVSQQLVQYVAENGGAEFFGRSGWRSRLFGQYNQLLQISRYRGEYETDVDRETAVRRELTQSKVRLEAAFNKEITHLCYPWFQGCALSDTIAAECGYQSLFYGLDVPENNIPTQETPVRIRRISEEYLFTLPGKGRRSIVSVWQNKLGWFAGRHSG
jgi:peptidoglycan/xylan/chitin deacetylase (PgdA/CDA1 family)